jgi:hypothetical protein
MESGGLHDHVCPRFKNWWIMCVQAQMIPLRVLAVNVLGIVTKFWWLSEYKNAESAPQALFSMIHM